MNTISSKTGAFLVVYQSRSKAVGSVVVWLVFVLGSLGALITPVSPSEDFHEKIAHLGAAYGGTLIFTPFLVWSIIVLFSKKPLLVFDDKGITTQAVGLIPWAEIAEIRLHKSFEGLFLAIIAKDIERLAMGLPKAAKKLRLRQKNMGMADGVSEQFLPMKAEQLLAQVKDYSAQQIRDHS